MVAAEDEVEVQQIILIHKVVQVVVLVVIEPLVTDLVH